MSDTKVSGLVAASTPLDESWLLALARGAPDNLDRRATLADVRGVAGPGLQRNAGEWSALLPLGDLRAVVFESDFLNAVPGIGSYNTGTGAIMQMATHALAEHGAVEFGTGSTATGRAGFIWPSANPAANPACRFGLGPASFRARVRPTVLSDGTNTYGIRIGFTLDPATSTPTDGFFFEYAPASRLNGNWWCVSRVDNVDRAIDSGVAVSATVFHLLEVSMNADATQIVSRINGAIVDANTTNLPGTRRMGYGGAILKTVGTTARFFLLDWLQVQFFYPGGRP